MNNKEYLGDGLYVEFDGWQIILSAPRENSVHFVALEPDVLSAFESYVKRLKADLTNRRRMAEALEKQRGEICK